MNLVSLRATLLGITLILGWENEKAGGQNIESVC